MTLTIGLVVNPIAGVGAALAWKGTDDVDKAWSAVENGQPQPVWKIVHRALESIPPHISINWLLGGDYPLEIEGTRVAKLPPRSHAADTITAVQQMSSYNSDLILFAGGDGTAADVATVATCPILGIPAGVKIFSPAFLHRPQELGPFLASWEGESIRVDLLDLDEDSYRQGQPRPRLITSALIPVSATVQSGKTSWTAPDTETFRLIAERIMDEGWLRGTIVVGPGSTMKNIFQYLDLDLSLLGVDLIKGREMVLRDATQEQLQNYVVDQIWVSPIGNQGHILGRGNRQIPPSIIRGAKLKVFATMEKARGTPNLFVDTGDRDLDEELRGFMPVIVGYHEEILKRVR